MPNEIKVGVTAAADYMMASKDFALTKVGTGATGSAMAKQQSLKNKQDDIVVVAGSDVYRMTASKLSTPKGKMPAVGDMVTVFGDKGQEMPGVVVHVDQEKSVGRKVSARDVNTAVEVGGGVMQFIFKDLIDALKK